MDHLIVTEVQILVNHDVSNIDLGNCFEGGVPFKTLLYKTNFEGEFHGFTFLFLASQVDVGLQC